MNWVHTENFKIQGSGSDRQVTLQILCGYLEAAATRHAAELGFSVEKLARRSLAWALAWLWFEFEESPGLEGAGLRDEESGRVRVKTWPVSVAGPQYRRDFLISWRETVLARAVTNWVVLNLESRRAERLPEFIAALQPENPELVLEVTRPRLPSQENAPELTSFLARNSDIDRNNHVNNACLTAWTVGSTPEEFSSRRWLKSLQLLFRAEARSGDVVVARGANGGEGVFLHGLFRLSDGRELVRARSVWS